MPEPTHGKGTASKWSRASRGRSTDVDPGCKFQAYLSPLFGENFLTEREQLRKIQSLLTGGVPV